MKFINLVLLIVVLGYTWCWFNEDPAVPQSVHMDIQNDVKKYISDYVETHLPLASKVSFKTFYTELIDNQNMKAHFTYSFTESSLENEPTTMTLTGFALLNVERVDQMGPNYQEQRWKIHDIFIPTKELEYHEPLKVHPLDEQDQNTEE